MTAQMVKEASRTPGGLPPPVAEIDAVGTRRGGTFGLTLIALKAAMMPPATCNATDALQMSTKSNQWSDSIRLNSHPMAHSRAAGVAGDGKIQEAGRGGRV
jgi:hypothetical protein